MQIVEQKNIGQEGWRADKSRIIMLSKLLIFLLLFLLTVTSAGRWKTRGKRGRGFGHYSPILYCLPSLRTFVFPLLPTFICCFTYPYSISSLSLYTTFLSLFFLLSLLLTLSRVSSSPYFYNSLVTPHITFLLLALSLSLPSLVNFPYFFPYSFHLLV